MDKEEKKAFLKWAREETQEDEHDDKHPRRMKKAEGGPNWIQKAIKHPGALHKELHVPEGKKIPAKKLNKALHSSNPKIRQRANLAKTLKGLHH